MPGRLGEPPSPQFYSPVSTHGAQAPQGGPAHSAAGTIGTLVLGAVQLREPLWGGRVDADLEQVAAGAAVGRARLRLRDKESHPELVDRRRAPGEGEGVADRTRSPVEGGQGSA